MDLDQQQQTLFDASVLKLQQEQLRHGVEPRLLRFVLINNALRALQSHMLRLVEGEDGDLLGPLDCDPFLCNTFKKHGVLSTAPLTPAKVVKLDSTPLTDQSPLVASRPWGVTEEEGVASEGAGTSSEKRPVNSLAVVNQSCSSVHLGKHTLSEDSLAASTKPEEKAEGGEEGKKRACHSHINGTKLNGTTKLHNMLEHLSPPNDPPSPSATASSREEEEEERASTPSPIDFTKVDPSLYDFDTRTSLSLPCTTANTATPTLIPRDVKPKSPSCSLQAIASPVVQNGEQLDHRNSQNGLPATPESGGVVGAGEGEADFLDDLDHIVSLLMT